jgi:hypothetical protein
LPVEQQIQYYATTDTTKPTIKTVNKSWYNVRIMRDQQTTLGGQSTLAIYCYNGSEEVTETDQYDFGTTAPALPSCVSGVPSGTVSGPLLKKTANSYASFGVHIVDRAATVTTYNGSGTRVAESDAYYDQTNSANRGNLTTVTKQCFARSTVCVQGNSTTTFTYDSNGQKLTMVDPDGNAGGGTPSQHTTTYSYTDTYTSCGGNAPPTSPSDSLLTTITFPPTNGVSHIVNYCYDYTSGLMRGATRMIWHPGTQAQTSLGSSPDQL